MGETPTVEFLGAAGTVTGSRHLVRAGGRAVLLDSGLFQGPKPLRQRNREHFPFDPRSLDAVVLSHAHLDHSGARPLLAKAGFRGPVFCTPGTADLLRPLLRDAAHLQEEEAAHANRHGYSKRRPALPLFTASDAEAVFPGRLDDVFRVDAADRVGGAVVLRGDLLAARTRRSPGWRPGSRGPGGPRSSSRGPTAGRASCSPRRRSCPPGPTAPG